MELCVGIGVGETKVTGVCKGLAELTGAGCEVVCEFTVLLFAGFRKSKIRKTIPKKRSKSKSLFQFTEAFFIAGF
jgi:hypothetical protein